jgi:predicted cobalt transporter CbtA
MVPLLPLGKRSVPNAPAGGTLRAAGAASTAEQSRWAAKGAGWECLTFDIKGEIIVGVEWIAVVPANSTLFSPSSALILFFILGSCRLRIQHS